MELDAPHPMHIDTDDPRLPPELEHNIFLFALDTTHNNVENLLLVAKRTHDWLLPALFNVVVVHDDATQWWPTKMDFSKIQKYGQYIRHLLLSGIPAAEVEGYLKCCPNLVNISFWLGRKPVLDIKLFQRLELTHLSLEMPMLEQILQPSSSSSSSSSSSPAAPHLFPTITHLDIAYTVLTPEQRALIACFPRLTHLALYAHQDTNTLVEVLETCGTLKVLVRLSGASKYELPTEYDSPVAVDDCRIVSIKGGCIKDWRVGAQGGLDMWLFADDIVERKAKLGKNSKEE